MSKAEVDYTAALHSCDHDSRSIELGLVCAEHRVAMGWDGQGGQSSAGPECRDPEFRAKD